MSELFDVIVVGGGIVGLTAAIAMRQRHFSVGIIDANPLTANPSFPDSRVYAINQSSQHLLQALGVWQKIDKTRVSSYTHMHVWDAASGAEIDFDARMVCENKLGSILEESIIKQALLQQAQLLDLFFFPPCYINHVQITAEDIRISSGENTWRAKLLMIADGASSPMRQRLGIKMTSWPYHQHAVVATVNTEKPHQCTAYQVFHREGPLAFLPLSSPHQCSIVWSTSPARANQLMQAREQEFNQSVTEAFAKRLGEVQLSGKRCQFPLQMRHVQTYQGERWLIMGDAAHTIHPLAGLGLNIGLADVSAWLDALDVEGGSPFWSSKRLGIYQRQRKYAVWQMIWLMESLKTLFTNPLPPVVALRGLGLNFCNNISALKRFFIEHATGK